MEELQSLALLFLTSRPIDLPVQFQNLVRLEISAKRSDMLRYLDDRIERSNLSKFVANDTKFKDEIIENLIENAAGM